MSKSFSMLARDIGKARAKYNETLDVQSASINRLESDINEGKYDANAVADMVTAGNLVRGTQSGTVYVRIVRPVSERWNA